MMKRYARDLSDSELRAIAHIVALTRQRHQLAGWDQAGICAALKAALRDRQPTAGELLDVACTCAANPDIRTPKVIALDGDHWAEQSAQPKPLDTPARPGVACAICGKQERICKLASHGDHQFQPPHEARRQAAANKRKHQNPA